MADHATVFFCKGYSYLLCYDDDLESLVAPNARAMPHAHTRPFELTPYSEDSINKSYVLRVVYRPEHTEYGRRPDGMVDRYTIVTSNWLKRMAWQFEAAFPAGLDDDHLLNSKDVEILY